MSNMHGEKPDFLEAAKQQLTQILAEFDQAIDAIKDPERRRQVTESALDKLQGGLARAQESVAKYQAKLARDNPTDGDGTDG